MIKSGYLNDMLNSNTKQKNFFMSKVVVKNEPSTKVRNTFKRRRVIAIEIEIIKNNFDINKFPKLLIED